MNEERQMFAPVAMWHRTAAPGGESCETRREATSARTAAIGGELLETRRAAMWPPSDARGFAMRRHPDAFELSTGTTHRVLRSRAAMRAHRAVA